MKLNLYKLKPVNNCPFHIGKISSENLNLQITDTIIHSDTIYSALYSVWNNIYEDDIEQLIQADKFLVSSAFHYYKEILFFIKPKIYFQQEYDPIIGKKIKKVEFVSEKIFIDILNGKIIDITGTQILKSGRYMCYKDELIDENMEIVFKSDKRRSSIDRINNATTLFEIEEFFFEDDCGFFILVKFKDDTIKVKFEKVLEILGNFGIGADRTSGKGQFKIEKQTEIELKEPDNADGMINLSLFVPSRETIKKLLEKGSYDLIKRGGWATSMKTRTLRKKSIYMFKECSIFSNVIDDGRIIDITPDKNKLPDSNIHNIFRIGKSINLKIKIPELEEINEN